MWEGVAIGVGFTSDWMSVVYEVNEKTESRRVELLYKSEFTHLEKRTFQDI